MYKKLKQARKRLPSLAMAGAMLLSTFLGAMPAGTLEASAAGNGSVKLLMTDSSVYGADKNHAAESLGSIPYVKEWGVWDDNLKTDHFLTLPEGLARMDGRNLVIYDMTDVDGKSGHGDGCYLDDKNYYKESCLKNHNSGTIEVGRDYTVEPFSDATKDSASVISLGSGTLGKLKDGRKYVVAEKGPAGSMSGVFYGYLPNVEDASDSTYGAKGWQASFQWANGADVYVGLDSTGQWASGGAVMGTSQQPLHNEVQRGGFKFHVLDNDKQSSESQGTGLVTDSYFAVFNISSAMASNAYTREGSSMPIPGSSDFGYGLVTGDSVNGTSRLASGHGYVVVDQDGNNRIDSDEEKAFFPAYDKDDVMDAWKEYLQDSFEATFEASGKKYADATTRYSNGLYGVDGSEYDTFSDPVNAGWGLFAMGKDSRGVPIIPCMVLKADADGTVKTGSYSLPIGNYLVLQVKAGDGYYIDENFAPVVSVGTWGHDVYNAGRSHGYGNGYFNVIMNNLENTEGVAKRVKGAFTASGQNPVAYVMAQSGLVDISTQCKEFGVNENGVVGAYNSVGTTRNAVYTDSMKDSSVSQGTYVVNPNGEGVADANDNTNSGAVGSRRDPKAGTSRFNTYDSIARAGVRVYIADSDDVLKHTSAQETSDAGYKVEPQGDGDLAGAVFRVYNDGDGSSSQEWLNGWYLNGDGSGHPVANKQQAGLGGDKKTLARGDGSYKDYVVNYDSVNQKYYFDIPVDELPFGPYRITQVSTGEGYGQETVDDSFEILDRVELSVRHIGVHNENKMDLFPQTGVDNWDGTEVAKPVEDVAAEYVKPALKGTTATYFPQKLVTGGKLLTVTPRDESAKNAEVTVKIFNISDYYVYVDKQHADGTTDGAETRYETAQTKYQASVAGKTLTVPEIASITSTWDDSCVYECTGKVSEITEKMAEQATVLPYGTYYVALTALTDGYSVIGNPGQSSPMHVEGGTVTWSVQIADGNMTPEVATVLVDSEYLIDSVPVRKEASVTDQVELGNLTLGTDYVVYGVVVDKATGDIAQGTTVRYAKVNGYQPPETGSFVGGENAASLVNEGVTYTTGAQRSEPAYYTWLLKIKDYAQGSGNSMLSSLVGTAMGQFTGSGGSTEKTHNAIIGVLKYMSGDSSAALPSGIALTELVYPHMDTTVMEGTTLVGYVFVCEASEPSSAALSAKSVGELMAATDTTVRAVHRSLEDESQTARIPSLDITAEASYSKGNQIDPTETVTGTITYGNVEPGCDYRITATLKDSAGKDILGEDGKPLTVTANFTARDTTGYEVVTFDGLDVEKYNGQRLTVYADLMRVVKTGSVETPYWLVTKGDADSMGWHINDPEPGKNQVDVVVPVVTTNLTDQYGNKEADFDGPVTLKDSIHYQTLIPGETYISVLSLVDADGKTLFDDAGRALTSEKEFVAKAAEQDVEVEITFTATKLRGADVIAFNDLYHIVPNQKALVAYEHDTETPSQTVRAAGAEYRIYFTTSVKDDATHTQYSRAMSDAALTDSVTIRNLDPSTKYVLKTELAKSANGNVLSQFEPVYTTVTSDTDGSIKIDVPIKANLSVFAGQNLSVYQTLYNEKETEIVAEHRDNTDVNQMVYVSDIDTVLTGGNGRSKKIAPNLIEHEDVSTKTVNGELTQKVLRTYTYETSLADQVYYNNLTPGNTYTVTTEIVSQDGKGTVATSEVKFTPSAAKGIATVYLDIDVTDFLGKKLVAYETITDTYSNTVVASHQDLTDSDQTVQVLSAADIDKLDDADDDDEPEKKTKEKEKESTKESEPEKKADDGEDIGDDATPLDGIDLGKAVQTFVAEGYWIYLLIAVALGTAAGVLYKKKRGNGAK